MTSTTRSVRLSEVALINPRRPALSRAADAPTTFIPMQAVNENLGAVDGAEKRPFGKVAKGYTYFEEGDVLFAKITPCMQNGKQAIARDLIDGIGFGTTEFHVVRACPELNAEWLWLYLRQQRVREAAERAFVGSVGQQRVPESFLAELEIPLPDITVQTAEVVRIRRLFGDIRIASRATHDQLQAVASMSGALFRAEFGSCAPIHAGRGDEVQRGWAWRPLQSLARLESGHTPSRRHPEWWGGAVPWLALPDIRKLHGKIAHDTGEHTNDLGLANSSARLLPVNTVCVSRTASIGFVTIMGRAMATSQDFCNWVCDPEQLDPEFLMYAFMASQDSLRELGSGAVHKTIYMPTIQSFHICAPGIEEQRRIVQRLRARLAAAEALQVGLRERLAEIERLPQRILAVAFDSLA